MFAIHRNPRSWQSFGTIFWIARNFPTPVWRNRDGAVMRALPAHHHSPGSILASHVGWVNHGRFSSLLRGFSSSFPRFTKATFHKSRQEEPSSGMSIAKFPFTYSNFIIHSRSHLSCFYSHNPEQRKLICLSSLSLSHLSSCEFSFLAINSVFFPVFLFVSNWLKPSSFGARLRR